MSKVLPPLSIVVPALNEADNLPLLVQRVAEPLVAENIDYEIVIIDDHSSDDSVSVARKLAKDYNVRLVMKQGKRGKAYSLLEGFSVVKYDLICMIDADLQYPPEAIVPMYRKLLNHEADVVVTNRIDHQTSFLRKLSTKVFHFLMARMLFGIDYDTQSGLKLFRKRVLDGMELKPSAWTFDLEFLIRSLEKNYTILSFAIPFGERFSGEAKINPFTAAYVMSKSSIKLRFNSSTRKIRRGYQTSMELSRRPAAMAAVFVAGLLSATVLMGTATTGQAEAASVFDPIRNLFVSDDAGQTETQPQQQNRMQSAQSGTGDAETTTQDPAQPATQPPAAQPTTQPAPQPSSQPTPQTSGTQTTTKPSSNTATTPRPATSPKPASTQPQTTRTTNDSNRVASIAKSDQPTAAATKDNKQDDNKDTDYYANQSLSATRTSQLTHSAKVAALVGAGIVTVALLAWGIRALYHKHQRKVSRNLYRV
jgi:outer membrane biosynthesis protein TonB